MGMLIVPLLLLIAVVIVVLIAAGIKAGNAENGGRNVIRNIYVYLVLFATLMMVIGGSVAAFMAVADIVAPTPYFQSFADFKHHQMEMREEAGAPPEPTVQERGQEPAPQLTEQELKEMYDAMVVTHREREVDRAKNALIKSFGWIIIPLPVFVYFQRRRAGVGSW